MVAAILVTQRRHGVMRMASAEAMWKLVKGVAPFTADDTRDLFFPYSAYQPRPGAPVPGERYFNASTDDQVSIARIFPLS